MPCLNLARLCRLGCAALLAFCCALPASAAEKVDKAQTRRLHAFFDARWDVVMKTYPEWATFVGDNRFGDRLEDVSPEAVAASYAATRRALAQARAFDRKGLSALDRTSLDVFIDQHEDWLRFEPFVGFRSMSLGALDGFQSSFSGLLEACPVERRDNSLASLTRCASPPDSVVACCPTLI